MLICIFSLLLALTTAQPTTHTYKGSSRIVPNPNRGFRHELDQLLDLTKTKTQVAALAAFNITVAQTYVYLPAGSDVLSDATLANLSAGLSYLRSVGLKALLRFAYDLQMPGENNYTFPRIQAHIKQLVPIVRSYADVLYCLQAGFCWVLGGVAFFNE